MDGLEKGFCELFWRGLLPSVTQSVACNYVIVFCTGLGNDDMLILDDEICADQFNDL